MRKSLWGLLLAGVLLPLSGVNSYADSHEASAQVQAEDEQVVDIALLSRELGWLIGHNLTQPPAQFNVEEVIKGIREGVDGKEPPMTDAEYAKQMAIMQEKAYKDLADHNLTEANEMLKQVSGEEGIQSLEGGKLLVRDIQSGSGPAPQADGDVLVDYTGKYADGTVFSASAPGEPVRLNLGEVVPGFAKGIEGMQQGGVRELYIHPDLAYGPSSALGPNRLLIFEIKLVDANPAPEQEDDSDESSSDEAHAS